MRSGWRRAAPWLITAVAMTVLAACSSANDVPGQPTDGAIHLQGAYSVLKHDAIWFHDIILMPIITAISLLVLGLLGWIVIRYNKRANPVPAKWSHNTTIEIVWTVVPVIILLVIALFSFRLLFKYEDMPTPDVTVKITGNQWNWAYEYPDLGVSEYISNMLPEDQARAAGLPYRLAATEPMVVPVGRTVRLQVTASDVIHAVALPAFGLKTDAVPGRINETWFNAERVGVYYGQCSELCGVDHAFMPLEIRVVTQAEFEAWVAARGGSMTYAADQAAAAAAAAAPAAAPAAEAAPAEGGAAAPTDGAAPTAETATAPATAPAAQPAPAPAH